MRIWNDVIAYGKRVRFVVELCEMGDLALFLVWVKFDSVWLCVDSLE